MDDKSPTDHPILKWLNVSYALVDQTGAIISTSGEVPVRLLVGDSIFDALPILVGMEPFLQDLCQIEGRDHPGLSLPFVELNTEKGQSAEFSLKLHHFEEGYAVVLFGEDEAGRAHEQESVVQSNRKALKSQISASQDASARLNAGQVEVVQDLAGEGVRQPIAQALLALEGFEDPKTVSVCARLQSALMEIDALAAVDALQNRSNTLETSTITNDSFAAAGIRVEGTLNLPELTEPFFRLLLSSVMARFTPQDIHCHARQEFLFIRFSAANITTRSFEGSAAGRLYVALCGQCGRQPLIEEEPGALSIRL